MQRILRWLTGVSALIGALSASGTAWGATFTVNTTADTVDVLPGDGQARDINGNTSLRAAVMEANALGSATTIHVPAGSYVLTITGPQVEDASLSGDLDVLGNIRVYGSGASATTVDGNQIDRVFHVFEGATLRLVDLKVTGGQQSADDGAGIENFGTVYLTRVVVTGNTSQAGGGGVANVGGFFEALDSEISLNTSNGNGGGFWNAGLLGSTPVAILDRCLVVGNESNSNGGGIAAQRGDFTAVNTTISGNTAKGYGGGVHCNTNDSAVLTHCTVTDNTADDEATGTTDGGGVSVINGTLSIANTLIAENRTPSVDPQNGSGYVVSLGYNLLDDTTGMTLAGDTATVIVAPDAMIGPLANNGGFTRTHALDPGSPAIDAADPNDLTDEDQRAVARPIDGDGDGEALTDIGAFEYEPDVGACCFICDPPPIPPCPDPSGAVGPACTDGLDRLTCELSGGLYIENATCSNPDPPCQCVGDITGDGKTDVFDFAAFVSNYGTGNPDCVGRSSGDLNCDGVVNVFDFATLSTNYGCGQ